MSVHWFCYAVSWCIARNHCFCKCWGPPKSTWSVLEMRLWAVADGPGGCRAGPRRPKRTSRRLQTYQNASKTRPHRLRTLRNAFKTLWRRCVQISWKRKSWNLDFWMMYRTGSQFLQVLRASQIILKRLGDASLRCGSWSRGCRAGPRRPKRTSRRLRPYQNASKMRPHRLRTLRNAFKTVWRRCVQISWKRKYWNLDFLMMYYTESLLHGITVFTSAAGFPNPLEASWRCVSELW